MTGKRQVVKTKDLSGLEVLFVVEPRDGSISLDQAVDGEPRGYRGHFTPKEAADLGAALLMAAGSIYYR